MRKIKFLLLLSGFYASAVSLQAQLVADPTVLAAAGTSHQSAALSLDWTLGELMTDQYTVSNLRLNQGFHQPYADLVPAYQAPELNFQLEMSPNPAGDWVQINADSPDELSCRIIDLTGRTVRSAASFQQNLQINLKGLNQGIYLVQVRNREGALLKTFKLLKTDF